MESSGSTLIGKNLKGRYRVDEFIGRGGMAEVYKVWDSHLSVHLGMKLLHDDLAEDRVFLRRFKREARTLEKLKHPNIVRFYGIEQDDTRAFILMDFVEGTTLRREIFRAGGPMKHIQINDVMRPVFAALGFAHREGIVHCDVKPANIMIDYSGRVLVTDFGISRMTDAATATMVGMGTPAYMAPELVLGEEPRPETDIYSLGVILYEMVTGGERPFTGEHATITGSTSEKVRWEQRHIEPPSPRKWNPEITEELEAVIKKCLSKEPSDRYGTVQELLDSLMSALHLEGVDGGRYPIARPESEEPEEPRKDRPVESVEETDRGSKGIKIPPFAYIVAGAILVGAIILLSRGGANEPDPQPTFMAQTVAARLTRAVDTPQEQDTQATLDAIREAVLTETAQASGGLEVERSSLSIIEEFDDPSTFSQTSSNVQITEGTVFWNIDFEEGQQYVYREIPNFNGDVKLVVTGRVDSSRGNCATNVGIGRMGDGNQMFDGLGLHLGFYGAGCTTSGYRVSAHGVRLESKESSCQFTGNWLWIESGRTYTAELTIVDNHVSLEVPNVGVSYGEKLYDGDYRVLYVGLTGNGTWPSCAGTIDSVSIYQLE